ncbi:MAG TPA: hypothetical protein PK167_04090 [Prolixibacteraceae bacterium]|nr:hypothetical protein [Prolixibacteraceae bacterium]
MERKGLFTPEQEEFIAEALDFFFKFKNPVIEKFDKTGFKMIVQAADNYGLDKIKPDWKTRIIPIVDAAIKADKEEVRRLVTDLMNEKIDIPNFDEETELMLFDSFTRFIAAAVDFYIQKKNAA